MYIIIDNEAGNIIEHAKTLEQAQQIIAEYEAADKKDGTHTPNFYAIKEKSEIVKVNAETPRAITVMRLNKQ